MSCTDPTAIPMERRAFITRPIANPRAVVGGNDGVKYRFTVLTSGLLRYEYSPDSQFEDRASTLAINRDLPVPVFKVIDLENRLEIITERFHLYYDKKSFSSSGLRVQVRGNVTNYHSQWRFGGDARLARWDLGGTARTLDRIDGRIPLGPGVIAKNGYMALDDSHSMLFTEDGWVSGRRRPDSIDGYLFTYGLDYKNAIKAFYAVSGSQPLLPRSALGNWWSRYYPYSANSYLALLDRFEEEGIPLAVGVIDMDWHWIDEIWVKESGFSGWTGYSWNTNLFPDPSSFLKEVHNRHLQITLNDHPADGVASFEDSYVDMCNALGRDAASGDPISFDVTNPAFVNAYFDVLLRKHEDMGVDFWWVDWQQGRYSDIEGVDPLWILNHFHYLNNTRGKRRPLTFSRFAGPGSHRYPVGFSGDTVVSWASLDFQPEFTATASNIGYGWWSHDIGGHMHGYKDEELSTRWLQLGVFSPILRLHSTDNAFNTKEPWRFQNEARAAMVEALRLRARLVPYLYSMNVRSAREDEPLVQPLYWEYSHVDAAYKNKNVFFFGSQLIVAPFTSPRDTVTRRARVCAWLPPGRYFDLFSGLVYDGNRELWIYRALNEYAVFAREGSIIPFDAASVPANGCELPGEIEVKVVIGKDAAFDLYEDDGQIIDVKSSKPPHTPMIWQQGTGTLSIGPASHTNNASLRKRDWTISFLGLESPLSFTVLIDGVEQKDASQNSMTSITVRSVSATTKLEIAIRALGDNTGTPLQLSLADLSVPVLRLIDEAYIAFNLKTEIWAILTATGQPLSARLSHLCALRDLDENLLRALQELLLADSRNMAQLNATTELPCP